MSALRAPPHAPTHAPSGCSPTPDVPLRDRGSASILGIAIVAVLVLGAAAVAMTAQAAQLRSFTQGVADVAAIAAAYEARDARAMGELHPRGAGAASTRICTAAAEVIQRNGLDLRRCAVDPAGAVTVEVTGQRGPWVLHRTARAGTA